MEELFPDAAEQRRPWTVTRLNREVRTCLEGSIGTVRVEGEISNLRRQPSGHQYFSLKDEECQVSCVLFRGAGASAPALRDGLQVEMSGQISVYEPRGQYQLVVRRVQMRGAGELEAKLRALQEKLRAEGLFDPDRKRALPPHPSRIGVVTSPGGAAIRDFLQILRRRAPHLAVFIAPVRVQGRGAALEIATAVGCFADPVRSGFPAVDVVVVTRGGGSLEDLWEFNEEAVARAIAACRIPVISAVGHEIDHTIADLAADVRAPTPSAAAEILSADRTETLQRLSSLLRRLQRETGAMLDLARARLEARLSSAGFLLPARRIADLRQRADDLHGRGTEAVRNRLASCIQQTRHAASVLRAREPSARLAAWHETLGQLQLRQTRAVESSLSLRRREKSRAAHALGLLGPQQTLRRGFTMTLDRAGRPLTSADDAAGEDVITTVFADGEIKSRPEN